MRIVNHNFILLNCVDPAFDDLDEAFSAVFVINLDGQGNITAGRRIHASHGAEYAHQCLLFRDRDC